MEGHAIEVCAPAVKLMREKEGNEEGEDAGEVRRRDSFSTGDLTGGCAAEGYATAPRFWALGQSIQVARQGLPARSKALGKAPAIQATPLPPEIDDKVVQWLQ